MSNKKIRIKRMQVQVDKIIDYVKEHQDEIIPLPSKVVRTITDNSVYSEIKEAVQTAAFKDTLVPVMVRYPHVGNMSKLPYAFLPLSIEEYNAYDFTGKNFRELSDSQVEVVKDRISSLVDDLYEREKDTEDAISKNRIRYMYLFLCATFFSMPKHYLPLESEYFASVMIRPKEDIKEMMENLVKVDLFVSDNRDNFISLLRPDTDPVTKEEALDEFNNMNIKDYCRLVTKRQYGGRNGIDRQIKTGIIDSGITYCECNDLVAERQEKKKDNKVITIADDVITPEEPKQVSLENIKSDDINIHTDFLQLFGIGYRRQLEELKKLQEERNKFDASKATIKELQDECARRDEEIESLKAKGEAYDVLAKRCSSLQQKIQILEDGAKRYSDDLKDYKQFRTDVQERTDRVAKRTSLQVMDIVTAFSHGQINENDIRIQVQDVMYDMVKTVENMTALKR